MKLAVMQPYFFPYIGYFQLIGAVDKFIFYDDVNFIKNGWINRNRILIKGNIHYITVPLSQASSFAKINEVKIFEENKAWRKKMLTTLSIAYAKAKFRSIGVSLVESVLENTQDRIADMARASIFAILDYLQLKRVIVHSSTAYANNHLNGQERVLDICRRENANIYLNTIGGTHLYEEKTFSQQGCNLKFLKPSLPEYPQGALPFVPGLSILDVIMHCDLEEIIRMLSQFELL